MGIRIRVQVGLEVRVVPPGGEVLLVPTDVIEAVAELDAVLLAEALHLEVVVTPFAFSCQPPPCQPPCQLACRYWLGCVWCCVCVGALVRLGPGGPHDRPPGLPLPPAVANEPETK